MFYSDPKPLNWALIVLLIGFIALGLAKAGVL